MKVNYYKLYCSRCLPSAFVEVRAEDVIIVVDLKTDEFVFNSHCPKCKNEIINKRRAF
jgi:hypothetical protein